jgi:hypothetical protein
MNKLFRPILIRIYKFIFGSQQYPMFGERFSQLDTISDYLPRWITNTIRKLMEKIALKRWEKTGYPLPPPHIVKQLSIKEYQDKYKYPLFVETGTYKGAMVEAQKNRFKRVISIELGLDLFKKVTKRFRNYKNITLLQGDSGKVLNEIISDINEPAIFWLDGHYSSGITAKGDKECPIFEELEAIFKGKNYNHILLIDDARCFIGEGDFPTIESISEYIRSKNEKYHLEVRDDIIRFVI